MDAAAPEPPHGFGDDARSRVLRRRPSDATLRWIERTLGGRVAGTRARKGGSTSAIHEVRLVSDSGAATTVILRNYVVASIIDEEPDLVEREARVLALLGRITDLPTPELLAADPDGSASGSGDGDAGTPCLVMSRRPGRVEWFPADTRLERWLEALADVLVALHATPLPEDHGLGRFDPYEPSSWDPPAWMRDATIWHGAVAAYHAPPLDDEELLIHRDYHPGNVLWSRHRVTGVVDWPVACRGPSSADAYWCWLNLLPRFGREVADRFLAIWERRSGRTYHPWAEVVYAVDVLDGSGGRSEERAVLEERVGRALDDLGLR